MAFDRNEIADRVSSWNRPEFIRGGGSRSGGYWPDISNIVNRDQSINLGRARSTNWDTGHGRPTTTDGNIRAQLVGDWPRFRTFINNLTPGISKALKVAARLAALHTVSKIRKGVKNQSPGGQAFKPLHPFTVSEKMSTKGIGSTTANRALIRSGSLMRFLTYAVRDDGSFEIGYDTDKTSGSSGAYLWMVSTWMQNNTRIKVNKYIRSRFAKQKFYLSKKTKYLSIPARPYILPVIFQERYEIRKIYEIQLSKKIFEF